MLYELKVASSLIGEHEAQCLHYAMLQGVPLVKLINFGEQKVRGSYFEIQLEVPIGTSQDSISLECEQSRPTANS